MAFRYINPGYSPSGGQTTFKSFDYNPMNGVAFRLSDYMLENFAYVTSQILLPQAFSTDIYGKVNIYFDETADVQPSDFHIGANSTYRAPLNGKCCIGVAINSGRVYLCNGSGEYVGEGIIISPCELYSIWFHVHNGSSNSDSYGELSVNGEEQVINFQDISRGYLSSDKFFIIKYPEAYYGGKKFYISELIISDEFISKDEKIMVLPVSGTITDMEAGEGGFYTATETGQTLLQRVDVAALTSANRANTPITGIAVMGNPAYYTNALVTTMTALSKTGTVTSEHGTCELDSYSTGSIVTGWGLSNATIADLQNMQFGWKAGT